MIGKQLHADFAAGQKLQIVQQFLRRNCCLSWGGHRGRTLSGDGPFEVAPGDRGRTTGVRTEEQVGQEWLRVLSIRDVRGGRDFAQELIAIRNKLQECNTRCDSTGAAAATVAVAIVLSDPFNCFLACFGHSGSSAVWRRFKSSRCSEDGRLA